MVDSKDFLKCFFDYQIAHIREDYVDTWYDVENDDGTTKTFKFIPMEQKGDIYITAESYYQ